VGSALKIINFFINISSKWWFTDKLTPTSREKSSKEGKREAQYRKNKTKRIWGFLKINDESQFRWPFCSPQAFTSKEYRFALGTSTSIQIHERGNEYYNADNQITKEK
jgi:hypothetical protein